MSVVAVTPYGNAYYCLSSDYTIVRCTHIIGIVQSSSIILFFIALLLKFSSKSAPVLNIVLLVEGSTVSFSCPAGIVLIGPNSATCMENGVWEPDPSQLMCNNSQG